MSTLLDEPEAFTFPDLQEQLGGVPAHRILMHPQPGTATEADVMRLIDNQDKVCELIDGTLVEKAMGWEEALIGGEVLGWIHFFLRSNDCGVVTGDQGTIRLWLGRVRIPDVAFFRYERFPGGKFPKEAIPSLTPDLAVEVLSESNTTKEMELKRRDYFHAGTRIVWEIDAETRTVEVFTGTDESYTLSGDAVLDGSDVLPGFKLPLKELFAKLDRFG